MNADRVELAKLAFLGLSKTERRAFLATFTDPAPAAPTANTPPQIIRRGVVAQRLARSERAVDRLAKAGILRKVTLPGSKRACGFLESDVAALIGGR